MASSRVRIAPSLLNADLARLGDEVAGLEEAGVDRFHWDVMDGSFTPNLTFGPDIVAAARRHTGLPFEVHLMVNQPELLFSRWVDAGCELITVHAEACTHLHRTLGSIRALGVKAGLALNPATPLSAAEHVLDLLDLLLVMTVNPGFGGQSYIASMEPKVSAASAMVAGLSQHVEVEVDGGIAAGTLAGPVIAGATTLVVGSALFRHDEGVAAAVRDIRGAIEETTVERRGSLTRA